MKFKGIMDDFSGYTYKTVKGGNITVLGHNGKTGSKRKYYWHCDKCFEDEEFWEGIEPSSVKTTLLNKGSPCLCGNRYKFTYKQHMLRVNRLIKNTTYKAVDLERGKNGLKFILECDICSADEDLWPYGSIKATYNDMKIGKKPCDCSSTPKYTDYQNIIRMNRLLKGDSEAKEVLHINKKTSFILECKVCSEDKELWPYGSIKLNITDAKRGNRSCGCGKTPRWTEDQNKIRIRRLCNSEGYEFLGWNGDYIGVNTLLNIRNKETGVQWGTTSLSSFMTGRRNRKESIEAHAKTYDRLNDHHIRDYLSTGSFLQGTQFRKTTKRGKDGTVYWEYWCPVCSVDEYVKNELCTGWFLSSQSSLKAGRRSCRCSERYRMTDLQARYLVEKLLREEKAGRFIDFSGGIYKGNQTKISWKCFECGNTHKTRFEKFRSGSRCSHIKGGFRPNKAGYLYFYEYYGYCESHIKYGITNKLPEQRNKLTARSSKLDYRPIAEFYHEDGQLIQDIETSITRDLKDIRYSCNKSIMPKGYSETILNTPENLDILMNYTANLKRVL